jgi:hypothetical protein
MDNGKLETRLFGSDDPAQLEEPSNLREKPRESPFLQSTFTGIYREEN